MVRDALDSGVLTRVARGLYELTDAEVGEMHSLVLVARRVPQCAVCLLSALRFHNLTTENPSGVWIAIDRKARKPDIDYPKTRVFRFGADRFFLGLEEHTIEGTKVRVYSVARTVVDLFRYRNKIGLDVAIEALREGWRERRFSLAEINRMARDCRMSTVMKPYLESLVA